MLIFGIMAFGQFMALLDTQIVAASLNSIQAGLSAGPDEIAWVQTAYLMAEIVMIPLAAFLSQALSTRWLFTLSAVLFTLSSLLCGFAWSIQSMTMFRAVQGFVGGAMVPTVFATGFAMFQGKQRAMIPAILGMVSTLAPTLGPTVGGWITDQASWRWLFFINVLPGMFIAIALPILGKVDEPNLSMLKRIDWLHAASLAVFLGCLQYVLEEGPRHQWLEDPTVTTVAWLSFVGALVFFERSFFSTMPVLKLTPFKRPTFVMACALNVVIGVGALRCDLHDAGVPGAGARFLQSRHRHHRVRQRHLHDVRRAAGRKADDGGGPALCGGDGLQPVRAVVLAVLPASGRNGGSGSCSCRRRSAASRSCSASCRRWAWR